jgi:thymidine kinase
MSFTGKSTSTDASYLGLSVEEDNHKGTLDMVIGPMFSGKTTWLNGALTNLADTGFNVLKIRYISDTRTDVASNDASGSTHNSSFTSLCSKINVVVTDLLANVDVTEYHVIGIDESSFYKDLVVYVTKWVNMGKHVRVAGLDGSYRMKPFGQTLELIPICDNIEKKKARCHLCLKELQANNFKGNLMSIDAAFTARIIKSDQEELIGGTSSYVAVCRYHHYVISTTT